MNARHLLIVLFICTSGGSLATAPAEPLSWVEHEAGGLSFPLPVSWEIQSGETIRLSDPSRPEWNMTIYINRETGASDEIRLLSALHRMMITDGYADPDAIPAGTLISSGMYHAAVTDRFGQVHMYFVRQIGSSRVFLVAGSSLNRSADELDQISRRIMSGISSRENEPDPGITGDPGETSGDGMNISIIEVEAAFHLSGTVSGSPLPPFLRCWIIGETERRVFDLETGPDGTVNVPVNKHDLPRERYYLVLQHPGRNTRFELYPDDPDYPERLIWITSRGELEIMEIQGDHPGVPEALIAAMSWVLGDPWQEGIDDRSLSFEIDPAIGEFGTASGCTGRCGEIPEKISS